MKFYCLTGFSLTLLDSTLFTPTLLNKAANCNVSYFLMPGLVFKLYKSKLLKILIQIYEFDGPCWLLRKSIEPLEIRPLKAR